MSTRSRVILVGGDSPRCRSSGQLGYRQTRKNVEPARRMNSKSGTQLAHRIFRWRRGKLQIPKSQSLDLQASSIRSRLCQTFPDEP